MNFLSTWDICCLDIPESDFTFETYLNESMNENFVFANITPDIIFETVNKLKPKNSSGKGNIFTKILNRIDSSIFVLSQTKNILPLNIRSYVYNSLVRLHIEYGIATWGGVKNCKLQNQIFAKKAIRAGG